jgi:hypothetical protein
MPSLPEQMTMHAFLILYLSKAQRCLLFSSARIILAERICQLSAKRLYLSIEPVKIIGRQDGPGSEIHTICLSLDLAT